MIKKGFFINLSSAVDVFYMVKSGCVYDFGFLGAGDVYFYVEAWCSVGW